MCHCLIATSDKPNQSNTYYFTQVQVFSSPWPVVVRLLPPQSQQGRNWVVPSNPVHRSLSSPSSTVIPLVLRPHLWGGGSSVILSCALLTLESDSHGQPDRETDTHYELPSSLFRLCAHNSLNRARASLLPCRARASPFYVNSRGLRHWLLPSSNTIESIGLGQCN